MRSNPFTDEINKHESRSLDDAEDREAVASSLNNVFGSAIEDAGAFDLIRGTLSERGGHLFSQDDNLAFFYGLPNNQTFHVAYTPDNSPKMHVTVLNIAPDSQELKNLFFDKFILNGWDVIKTQFNDILLDPSKTSLLYSYNTLPDSLKHEAAGHIFEGEEDTLCFIAVQGNVLCVATDDLPQNMKEHTGFESYIDVEMHGDFVGEPDAFYIIQDGRVVHFAPGPLPYTGEVSLDDLPVRGK